jgi:mono/diheme cytochrome c family protein
VACGASRRARSSAGWRQEHPDFVGCWRVARALRIREVPCSGQGCPDAPPGVQQVGRTRPLTNDHEQRGPPRVTSPNTRGGARQPAPSANRSFAGFASPLVSAQTRPPHGGARLIIVRPLLNRSTATGRLDYPFTTQPPWAPGECREASVSPRWPETAGLQLYSSGRGATCSACHAEGRGFESLQPLSKSPAFAGLFGGRSRPVRLRRRVANG